MQQITVKIDGMMCGMCEAHVCDAIRNSCKVKKVKASHKKGEAVILAEELSEDTLKAAIEKTGYRVLSVETVPYQKKHLR